MIDVARKSPCLTRSRAPGIISVDCWPGLLPQRIAAIGLGDTMSLVFIEMPREIIHATRMTPQELRRELVICLFQQGKLSFGKARELSAMSAWVFQQLLGSRGIAVHYDIDDYQQDLKTLRELGRL